MAVIIVKRIPGINALCRCIIGSGTSQQDTTDMHLFRIMKMEAAGRLSSAVADLWFHRVSIEMYERIRIVTVFRTFGWVDGFSI